MEAISKKTATQKSRANLSFSRKAINNSEIPITAVVELYHNRTKSQTIPCYQRHQPSKKLSYRRTCKNIPKLYNEVLVYGHELKAERSACERPVSKYDPTLSTSTRPILNIAVSHSNDPYFTAGSSGNDLLLPKVQVQKQQFHPSFLSSPGNHFQSIPHIPPISPICSQPYHTRKRPWHSKKEQGRSKVISNSTTESEIDQDNLSAGIGTRNKTNSFKSGPIKITANTITDTTTTESTSTSNSQILAIQSKQLVIPKITVRSATPLCTTLVIPEINIRTATPQTPATCMLPSSSTSVSCSLTQQFINRAKLYEELSYLKGDLKHSTSTN